MKLPEFEKTPSGMFKLAGYLVLAAIGSIVGSIVLETVASLIMVGAVVAALVGIVWLVAGKLTATSPTH